jgi:predicted nucleotidyltransferase
MTHEGSAATRNVGRTDAVAQVRAIVAEALAGRPVTVWLFGSWARGDQAPGSDIDVAVSAREPLPPGVLALLRERLEESTVPYRVEVVDLTTAPAALRGAVLREGTIWISP